MKKVISVILLPAFILTIVLQDLALAAPAGEGADPEGRVYSLAVLDLEPSGRISVADAGKITDRLRQELQTTGMFELLDKDQVMAGLAGTSLLESGCSTVECAIEAGRKLGVKLIVNGTINRIGPLYFIEVQIVHVKSGQIVQKVKDEVDGDFKKLEARIPTLTRRLVGTPSAGSATRQPAQTAESSQEVTAVENTAPTQTAPPAAEPAPDSSKSRSGKTLLVAGLLAVGVGAGIFAATAMGKDNNNNGNGGTGGTTPGTLPSPPTFP
ncbi:MAG: DUF3280 domain-containing protein [candidate division KSB1 bacterium]|nr:DUF3280 domain-containing protein [candidate division KSB1 bacterium]MDZ7273401.1 DUF3280 domain-containing protein [candidate division KSB1 bacterium]MDZ7287006.1 DUF3280 domain-containing protein [candidate division KSB1 bacterium]MDZ7299641.1 DUF3280 domain-containing protein [candidate division KSB1 bacterium]MDZ7307209.1 DUF3280 domain-containing protein [candidate division KSB1 bacterium]